VLYGGEDEEVVLGLGHGASGAVGTTSRVTLAASRDLGATWTHHRVVDDPGLLVAGSDYMHLAVAPDTGDILATVVLAPGLQVVLHRSGDGGATWTRTPVVSAAGGAPTPASLARVAAGPGGLVLVRVNLPGGAAGVAVSHDGGATFSEAVPTPRSEVPAGAPAVTLAEGGILAVLPYARGQEVHAVASRGGGEAWGAELRVAGTPEPPLWTVAAGGRGSTAVLTSWARCVEPLSGPSRTEDWGVGLVVLGGLGEGQPVPLAERLPRGPTGCAGAGGDDYGGLAFASDGSLWAAWSDPRGGLARIAVARILPAGPGQG
jgi:hypothetical protein